MIKLKLLFVFFLFSVMGWGQVTIFSENMGTPTGITAISANTFQNDGTLTYSGTGDVRSVGASTGYTGASGNGNVFITNTSGLLFEIANINTIGYTGLNLSFGHYKSTIAGNNELFIEVSPDGTTYTPLTYSRASGSGTAKWVLITPTGTIPSTANLRIRFRQTATAPQFRIDDVILKGNPSDPTIILSPTAMSGFSYVAGSGPSTEQIFTAGGTNLSTDITLTATADYEISTIPGSGFGASLSLTPSGGTVSATTIYVRLKAVLPVATYNSQMITAASTGASTQSVTCNGSVTAIAVSNDLCASATDLAVNAGATSGNMTSSTFTAPFNKKDVWYSFTPTCAGTHAITVAGFTGDVDIELFSGSCPATVTTLVSSSGSNSTEIISTILTSGTTYYLRVLAFDVIAETSAFTAQIVSNSVLTLTNAGSPATGNINAGTANALIMGFTTTPTCATNYSITNVTLSKAMLSTVTTADISNFRIFYDANGNGIIDGGETSVSGSGIALAPTMVFTLTGQTGITAVRKYLLVADVALAAVNGNKIKINLTPNLNLTAVLSPTGTGTGTALGNTQTITPPTCTSAIIANVTPASGPVGTEVTITASSGSLSGATATFNGVMATVVSSSATQLVVKVPNGAFTGNLVITDSQPCNATIPFTVVNNEITSCQGVGNSLTDLIISEVYDSSGGNVWHMELFNPTNAAINLDAAGANYRLERFATIGGATPSRIVDLSGIILPGAVYLADLGTITDPSCPKTYDFTDYAQGINALDEIKLTKEGIAVDIVDCPNQIGYTITRNTTAVGPTPNFIGADWNTISTESCTDLGLFSVILNIPPAITAQPSLSLTCSSTSALISVTAGEGFSGGAPLAYQWYAVAPGASTWTELTDAGVYSGTTSNVMNISSLTGLNNYQYYCQVRENGATCYQATIAVKITAGITTIWNGTGWSDGLPTLGAITIINGTYDMSTLPSLDVCSLIVNSPFAVTVTVNKYINIQNDITVNPGATLTVLNNGSLVQFNDSGINTGTISMNRTASIRKYDYVYWSSPVTNFPVSGVSPDTSSGLIYKWNTTMSNSNGGFGNWENSNENMVSAKGYIIRGPDGFNNTIPQALNAEFIGIANNGIYTPTISRGAYEGSGYPGTNGMTVTKYDDNWNLVGNPYPSAIKALDFLNANPNLDGFVNLWTHGTLPGAAPNPFYGSYAYNYTATDYTTYNATGTTSGPLGFNGYIAAGQGFFVMMNDGPAATQPITFNNSMRSTGYDNTQFYRSSASHLDDGTEKHSIWLDLISSTSTVSRMLVGYVAGATLERDRLYDAVTKVDNDQNFYSLLGNEPFKIQGRPVPFDANDQIPLGIKLTASGSYTIALGATDGLFQSVDHPIFLEDKLLNIIHDLKQAPYGFTAVAGKFDNRFVLRYTNISLGDSNFNSIANSVVVATGNQEVRIQSRIEFIKNIMVYDILGRLVFEKKNVNADLFSFRNFALNHQTLLVKVVLENGQTLSRKIIF